MSAVSIALVDSHVPVGHHSPLLEMTVGDLLRQVAAEVPDRIAVIRVPTGAAPAEPPWTYDELLKRSEDLARRLLENFAPGERIAIWSTNKPEWVLLQMASALAGIVLVTLNPANRIDEMRYLLKQSAACGLFLDRTFRKMDNEAIVHELQPDLPALRKSVYFDEWAQYLEGPRSSAPLPTVSPSSTALMLFTSGTTGKPKCVVLTHRGIVNNARYSLERYKLAPGSVWLSVLPFFHVGGSVTNTLSCLNNRGTHAVMSEFHPEVMLRAIETYKATIAMGVPIMAHAMLDHEAFPTTDLSSLQLYVTGGTTVAPELVRVIRQRFNTDVAVIFGQTEAGGAMCITERGDDEEVLCNTVGKPIASYEMRIIDTSSGTIVPIGELGEICIRSACTMREYLGMPDQTAQALDTEGWIHTGDLGLMRADGYVSITGRLKDMIIRGGENIYPREIEDTLATHPSISQVAVFGVPDAKWGEQVAAAVVLHAGHEASEDQLSEFLAARISKHKVPKFWTFVNTFPTNPTGKIQKFVLREQFIAALPADHTKSGSGAQA